MSSIPLPALQVRSPEQQANPLEMYGNLVRLKGLQQQQQTQQQLAPLQVQNAQEELRGNQMKNQESELALKSQQAMSKAYAESPTDPAKAAELAGKYGALPKDVLGLSNAITQQKMQALDLVSKQGAQAKAEADLMQGAHDTVEKAAPEDRPFVYQQQLQGLKRYGMDISQLPPQYPGDHGFKMIGVAVKAHSQNIEEAVKTSEAEKNTAQAASANAEAQQKQVQMPGFAAEAQAKAKFAVPQAKAQLSETRARTAEASANVQRTLAETRNMGEQPIFAVDPATNERVMTTRPEAQAKGYTNPVPVKEGDVSKETDARAMINDVQLNKSRYQLAMSQMYQQPVSAKQAAALTALTPEKLGMDFGVLKVGVPDVMQKVMNAQAFSELSPTQKQAVVGYYSTLASVPAAQKALTNIGRSNKEMMDLELRTIPTPLMDQGSFNAMLDRFQGNIDQTSRKTVRLPGMPSTGEIRKQYENPQQTNFNIPRPMQGASNQGANSSDYFSQFPEHK